MMRNGKLPVALILTVLTFLVLGTYPLLGADGFRLPDYEKFVMKNGLTVYLMEQGEVPLITVSAVFPAGVVKDNGKSGQAFLTAEALLFGTKSFTKQEIEETLDYLGADYGTSAGKETASLTVSFMNKDVDQIFPIVKEIVVDPVFDAVEFEKRKTRLLAELDQAKERPASVIGSYFDRFMYQDHIYAYPRQGIKSTVSKIMVEDVRAFYGSNYHANGSALAVVGDFNTGEMKRRIKRLFKDWTPNGDHELIPGNEIPKYHESRLLLVNKDDATETRFQIGGFGIERSNPDFVAVQVINTILGGRFTSWLNDELRVNRGLTYGAGSYFRTYKHSGTFRISSYTRTEKTIEAIDVALEVLDRLHTEGVDEETLTSAKNYINGQYPPEFETAGQLADLLTSMFVYGFDESFINDFQKNVSEMTTEKAREIIAEHFPKENLQFVLIGKASEIRDQVSKYGAMVEKDIKDVGF